LIRASDGYHLWSESYDRKLEDILVVQQEIAGLIATTLKKELTAPSRNAVRLASLEAHDQYLLGRYYWNRLTPEDLETAVGYYQKAIALEPNSALAYGGLADTYSYMIDLDIAPTAEILPKARAAADKALELDPRSAEAHTARGLVAHELEWDQTRAKAEFLRAIELNPNYAYGVHWYAHFLESQGRLDDAYSEMQKALALDPLSRMFTVDSAMIRYKQRRYPEALVGVDRAAQLDPGYFLLDATRALIYLGQHDWPRAVDAEQRALTQMGGSPDARAFLAGTQALAGDIDSARKNLALVRQAAKTTYVPDGLIALIEYAIGDKAAGRESLKKAVDGHNGMLVWMKTTPLFDQVVADPEGKALLEAVGGPPAP
jgi:serine/threonine-protein kinase